MFSPLGIVSSDEIKEGVFKSRLVGALPPVFTASFQNGSIRLYNRPEVVHGEVQETQEGLRFARPGQSFVEVQFNVEQKLSHPFNLSINPLPDQNVRVTLNDEEVSGTDVTSLIHEGKNVVRITLREDANASFTLSSISLSRQFNGIIR